MKGKKVTAIALTGILTAAVAFVPVSDVRAASKAEYTKSENVYVCMDTAGEVDGTYVVNTFTVTDNGEITDYGDYDSVQNLTNLDEIEKDKDEYTIQADKGKFYYQGNMDNAQIPWNFEIQYVLDGKEVDADEVAGAEGDLEIHMFVKENPVAMNPKFFQSYLLQASLTLDSSLCEEIRAKGANIVDAGSNVQVTYTVMPNAVQQAEMDKEDVKELVIYTKVTDFEMDDISINGAAMADFPVSFASADNSHTGQTMFIMSAKGVTIPEEKVEAKAEKDNRNFLQKLIDKIKYHNN